MDERARFLSQFEIDDDSQVWVVSLAGQLDPIAVENLHPQVQELVKAGFRRFVFDLTRLEYLGSLGLRLMVGLAAQVKGEGSVALCDLSENVRSVIELTRLDQILPTYPTRDDALKAIRPK